MKCLAGLVKLLPPAVSGWLLFWLTHEQRRISMRPQGNFERD